MSAFAMIYSAILLLNLLPSALSPHSVWPVAAVTVNAV